MCPSALVPANTLLVENILLFGSSEAEWTAAELREAHRGSLRKYIPIHKNLGIISTVNKKKCS